MRGRRRCRIEESAAPHLEGQRSPELQVQVASLAVQPEELLDETRVAADAKEVKFAVDLKAGTELAMQSFCYDATGKELCGAYFAYVTRR